MNRSDFYYDLPKNLIAQTPLDKRDHSKLMVLNREDGRIEHKYFYNILDYVNEGDCLILNSSKVIPARLYGIKAKTGAKVEFLLLNQREKDVWESLAGPGKRAKIGSRFIFGDGILEAEVVDITDSGNRILKFSYEEDFYSVLDEVGQMPLPHYITKELKEKDRYQTVYCDEPGSAAAPTAGLHFTDDLLNKASSKGIDIGFVTLHVGLGTFRPVKTQNILEHHMHSEYYEMSEKTASIIKRTKENGKKVFAVGTTSCRTIESVYRKEKKICKSCGWTDIFIYPGYKFNVMDGLITNFHLPESTLIMLVSAFAGHENTMNAYREAVREKYRFFSFGDAMIII